MEKSNWHPPKIVNIKLSSIFGLGSPYLQGIKILKGNFALISKELACF